MLQISRVNFTFGQMFSKLSKVVVMITITTLCIVGAVNAQTELIIRQNTQTFTPLVIVDGSEWEGSINGINPRTIDSITVLKDQSAVEKYGEKGKNGVIIITTRFYQAGKLDAPLIFVDEKEWEGEINGISPETIESITVLKDQSAVEKYGEKGKNGVVIITTKK